MKEAMRSGKPSELAPRHARRPRKRIVRNCSICTQRIPLEAIAVMEPEGAPEPRQRWILCHDCYPALVEEMHRSPIRSPLRLRIAMGMVAAERRPQVVVSAPPVSRSRTVAHDQRVILFITWTLIIAMLLHLMIIIGIALITR